MAAVSHQSCFEAFVDRYICLQVADLGHYRNQNARNALLLIENSEFTVARFTPSQISDPVSGPQGPSRSSTRSNITGSVITLKCRRMQK